MKKILLISIFFLFAADILAQSFYSNRINRRWTASLGLGYARSLSDLTNPGSYFDSKLNLVGGMHYRFTNRISAGASLMAFQLSGDDKDIDPDLDTQTRGLSFVSNNIELSATTLISLFPSGNRFTQRRFINPFLVVGVGVLYFDPRAEVPEFVRDAEGEPIQEAPRAGEMVSLRQYQTERPNSYGPFTLVIPVGIGVRMKVTEFMDVTAQMSNRITFTDYLDDVSERNYPDLDQFDLSIPEDRTAAALSDPNGSSRGRNHYRGNPEKNDFYLIFNVKAEFYMKGGVLAKLFGGGGGKSFNINPRRRRGGLFRGR